MPQHPVPVAPRVSAPDLPARLGDGPPPQRGQEYAQVRWTALDAATDAAHARFSECELDGASLERLDLTGASVVDVEIRDLRAIAVIARTARLRRVRITGGRIGTLDLADTDLDEVELVGLRIDYLSIAASRVADLRIVGSSIGTLDLPHATLSRMAFVDSSADEVDTRGVRATDLDLRGLEALNYLDPGALRGATLSARQVEFLAPAFAVALGIRVID